MKFDEQLIVPNESSASCRRNTAPGYNSVNAKGSMSKVLFDALAAKYGFSLETPFKDLPRKIKDIIFYGMKEKLRITYSNVRGTGTYDYAFEGSSILSGADITKPPKPCARNLRNI